MQNCKFCGSSVPESASFCGYCGAFIKDQAEVTDVISLSPGIDSTFNTPPPLLDPLQDSDLTIGSGWLENGPTQNIKQFQGHQSDESQTIFSEMMLPGMLMGEEASPAAGNVPLVHGTSQVGDVPTIQGTPSMLHSPPAEPELAHGAGSPTSPSPPHMPQTPLPQQYPQPLFHQQTFPQSMPSRPEHYEYSRPSLPATIQPARRPHRSQRSTAISKPVASATIRWVVLVVNAFVAVATAGIIIAFASPAALSLSGSSSVSVGGTLQLHGKGFLPAGSITFTIDNGLPVTLMNHDSARAITYRADSGAGTANAMEILLDEPPVAGRTTNIHVSVSMVGTFDAAIPVNKNWVEGTHTLHATESFGGRTANLPFKIVPLPKLLTRQQNFTSNSKDCLTITGSGNLIRGWLCTVTLSTASGDLSWTASSSDSTDQFTPSHGVAHSNHPESVTVFIPNEPHCSNATFTFKGQVNTVSVSWSCPTQ